MISVTHLTKDYGYHRGVFDISFEIYEGEILGILCLGALICFVLGRWIFQKRDLPL